MPRIPSVRTRDLKRLWDYCDGYADIRDGRKAIGMEMARHLFPGTKRMGDVTIRYMALRLTVNRRRMDLAAKSPIARWMIFLHAAHRKIEVSGEGVTWPPMLGPL
jgi:hypothetical protein